MLQGGVKNIFNRARHSMACSVSTGKDGKTLKIGVFSYMIERGSGCCGGETLGKHLKNPPDRGVGIWKRIRYDMHCKDELTSKALNKNQKSCLICNRATVSHTKSRDWQYATQWRDW